MSRMAATMGQGRANKRFLMLALALGLLGAILVYVAAANGSSSKGSNSAADTPVVVAKQEIPARTKITKSMVEVRLVAAADASDQAYSEVDPVIGTVTRFPIAANEQILPSKVVPLTASTTAPRTLSYVLPEGMRGVAINVSEVQDAGGLVLPGDYVDILAVFDVEVQDKPNDPSSRTKLDSFLVRTLLQNVEVLSVSQQIVDLVPEATPVAGGQRARNSDGKPDPGAKTVTLAVTPEQAQKLYLAEENGRLRMSVRRFGDSTEQPIDPITELDLWPRDLPNPFIR
jgi:pilus assembly protein CpaB